MCIVLFARSSPRRPSSHILPFCGSLLHAQELGSWLHTPSPKVSRKEEGKRDKDEARLLAVAKRAKPLPGRKAATKANGDDDGDDDSDYDTDGGAWKIVLSGTRGPGAHDDGDDDDDWCDRGHGWIRIEMPARTRPAVGIVVAVVVLVVEVVSSSTL